MKTLQSLYVYRLQHMELVTMLRETTADTQWTAPTHVESDVPLKQYHLGLKSGTDAFEVATRNPTRSPLTEVLIEKDRQRDLSISRFGRKLYYFEVALDGDQQANAAILMPLWERHRSLTGLNQAKQTGATDNFLNDLSKEPFAAALNALGMQPERDDIRRTNDDYRTTAAQARTEAAEQPAADVKNMRRELVDRYRAFCHYVVAMANAYPDNAEWNALVDAIDIVRRRYAEVIALRATLAGKKKNEETGK